MDQYACNLNFDLNFLIFDIIMNIETGITKLAWKETILKRKYFECKIKDF